MLVQRSTPFMKGINKGSISQPMLHDSIWTLSTTEMLENKTSVTVWVYIYKWLGIYIYI